MGYLISYGQTTVKEIIKEKQKFHFGKNQIYVIVACSLLLMAIFLGSKKSVQNFFLPGNSEVTRTALDKMVRGIREGESVGNAVTAFCREIVQSEGASE